MTHFEPTDTHVSSLAAGHRVLAAAGAGVHRNGFADDKTILHQFTDLLACEKNVVKKTKQNVRSWKYCSITHKTKGKSWQSFETLKAASKALIGQEKHLHP